MNLCTYNYPLDHFNKLWQKIVTRGKSDNNFCDKRKKWYWWSRPMHTSANGGNEWNWVMFGGFGLRLWKSWDSWRSYLVKFTAGKGNKVGPLLMMALLDHIGLIPSPGIFAFLVWYNSGNKDRNSSNTIKRWVSE